MADRRSMGIDKEYFMTRPADDLVARMGDFHGAWTIWGSNPIIQSWVRNSISYYSAVLEPNAWDTSLVFEGEQGELVKMVVPQARLLTRQLLSLITKQKLAFSAIARSSGGNVMESVRLANSLSEQIVDKQRVDSKQQLMCEHALVYGQGFCYPHWRIDRGQPLVPDEQGRIKYTGELEWAIPSVFDVFFDYQIQEWDELEWVEVRTKQNRHDLIAQFPDLRDQLLTIPPVRDWQGPHYSEYRSISEDDLIYTYWLYHKPTPALPDGRMVWYADERTIFNDGPNRYGTIPVETMKPEPIFGMGLGYPMFSNLLGAQEMLDHSFSAIATNQSAFAVQNVTVPRGAGVNVTDINGMNYISYTPQNVPGGGKPEPLQLAKSAPETFKFMEVLQSHMEMLSSMNPALRGNPPPGVTSGVAISTLSVNALEFIDAAAKSWQDATQRGMDHAINAYAKFSTGHAVEMSSKQGAVTDKEFDKEDLADFKRVKLGVLNPVMKTMAGRTDLAEKMVAAGLVSDIQEYVSVIEGAPFQQLYETELSENELVKAENDRLADGEMVPALAGDDHPDHIRNHYALLNDIDLRMTNPTAVETIMTHIMEHHRLAQETDPLLMAMARTGKLPEGGLPQAGPPPQMGAEGQLPPAPGAPAPTAIGTEMPGELGRPVAEPADDLLGRMGVR